MKKLLALILALALMLSAALALAEDDALANARFPNSFPNIKIGADPREALELFNTGWKGTGQYSYSDTPENETITLSDGTSVTEMTLPAVKVEERNTVEMTAKFYFIDNMLAAAVQILPVPEGFDASQFADYVNNVMGTPVPLNTSMLSARVLEIMSKTAPLEDGMNAWPYELAVDVSGNPAVVNVMMTAQIVDNTVYMAEFAYEKAGSNTAADQKLMEIEGFDKLTAEEQNAVQLYAEFLQKQQNEQLKQYVDFLQTKHQ